MSPSPLAQYSNIQSVAGVALIGLLSPGFPVIVPPLGISTPSEVTVPSP